MAPGKAFWEVFGHNALIVVEADRRTSYNFGYFDFSEPGFLGRFIDGEMLYELVAQDAGRDLEHYLTAGRPVSMQRLNLDEAQIARLVEHLQTHAKPENSRYRYDYFLSNCSTKVRDAIDFALDGALNRATKQRSHGYTFRALALAHGQPVPWMYLGMQIGLGRPADRALSIWQEFYIPALLKQMVDELSVPQADGSSRPLLAESKLLGSAQFPNARTAAPLMWPWAALLGALLVFIFRRLTLRRRYLPRSALLLASILGIGGLTLAFLWGMSGHWATAWNQNLVLFNPLYLLLLLPIGAKRREQLAMLLFVLGALGSFFKVFPAFSQQNLECVLLVLPLQWALWQMLRSSTHSATAQRYARSQASA